MPHLARIHIHPFKSLDPQPVEQAILLGSGALQHDRRFALADRQGELLTAKRTPAAHGLRTALDLATNRLSLRVEGTSETHVFDVLGQRRELALWLSEYFATPLDIVENTEGGFPDDTDSPGPTVISTATLAAVGTWFPQLAAGEPRGRFRANLEIDGVEAFWEDRLVAEGTGVVRFQIGRVELWGTTACQRCPVPSRNPHTGEVTHEFAKLFSRYRQKSLPAWAPASRFDHFYRLAVNTRPTSDKAHTLRVGDEVRVLGVEGV